MSRASLSHELVQQKIIFSLSVDHFCLYKQCRLDEMSHYATFHLGLHCLQKYTLRSQQYTEV